MTAERAAQLCDAPVVAVCGDAHRFYVQNDLQGLPTAAILVEPVPRNTAAAMALACVMLEATDPLVVMMPCDHHLPDLGAFASSLEAAAELAGEGHLVLLGVKPTHPATGFGYIARGAARLAGHEVAAMREKPDAQTAAELVASGCLWNSGMLVARVSRILQELATYAPEVLAAARAALADGRCQELCAFAERTAYEASPNISLDYAVLEKSTSLACVAYEGRWSDLGSWPAMGAMHPADAQGNVTVGDAMVSGCEGTVAISSSRLVCVQGLRDAVVVETPDAVYVSSRDNAEQVKQVVAELQSRGRVEADMPYRVHRPWGWYESLTQGPTHQSKRLFVRQGAAISLQYHHLRSEHWVVVSGRARIRLGDDERSYEPGESVFIPAGCVHRLSAPDEDVVVIEVQTGTYFGEDDIVRLEDRYARDKAGQSTTPP